MKKEATVLMKYKWLNTNPFRSVYFACLQMAAEFSTGIICMAYLKGTNKKNEHSCFRKQSQISKEGSW